MSRCPGRAYTSRLSGDSLGGDFCLANDVMERALWERWKQWEAVGSGE
jgi:hypothetical protein